MFSGKKEILCVNVVEIEGKEKCVCRKVCACEFLVIDKTRWPIRLDKRHRQQQLTEARNNWLMFIGIYTFFYR